MKKVGDGKRDTAVDPHLAPSRWKMHLVYQLMLVLCFSGLLYQSASGQSVRVYSEFQRIGPFGKVIGPDRARRPGVSPREILSPAVARNAYASYQIAVSSPAGEPFTLHIAQNPENTGVVSVYEALFVSAGGELVPDRLVRVELPHRAKAPEINNASPEERTIVFWMDLWVQGSCRPGRFRLEVQVYCMGSWIIYPMEVRVEEALIPPPEKPFSELGEAGAPADLSARRVLIDYLCGNKRQVAAETAPSIRSLIRRNALQDIALAKQLQNKYGKNILVELLQRVTGSFTITDWCRSPEFPEDLGAEWYLRLRDALYRMVN